MIKRLLAWPAAIFAVQGLLLAWFLLFGSFAYMGAGDTTSMRAALELYAGDLNLLFQRLWALDTLVLILWTLPLGVAYVAFRPRWRSPRWLLFVPAFALAYALWLGLCVLRAPTLVSPVLYGDGSPWTAAAMRAICTSWGPLWLALGFAAIALALSRLAGGRMGLATLGFYGLAVGGLVLGERYQPALQLKPGSVVLLAVDSLRSDRFSAEYTPRLHAAAQRAGAVVLPQVVPPVARTTPAVISLLTGRLPAETKVTTMFSNEETFDQTASVVSKFRAAGYCTLAIGEYPAEMLSRYRLGFEHVDVPPARFRDISLQAVLSNDPFFLASESWALLRKRMGKSLRRLVEGIPTFAAPRQLLVRFEDAVARCGDRPVFAFVFPDQPHFPYSQTWPYYLKKGAGYSGRFQFGKDDPNSTPRNEAERQRIRTVYETSLLATDDVLGGLVEHLAATGQLQASTLILTGDHGESLYDSLGIIGHGDQVGEMEGIVVPWVAMGAGREAFSGLPSPLESTHLAQLVARIRGLEYRGTDALPADAVYVETDMWMATTANVPKHRLPYPELSGVLTVKHKDADIEIEPSFLSTIEYAKHRLWILDGVRYVLEPGGREIVASADGRRVDPSELPPAIRTFLHRFYSDVAPALVP